MNIQELEKKISKLKGQQRGAMSETQRVQVEALDEHTLALYETALQTALQTHTIDLRGAEVKEGALTLARELNASLSPIVSELGALRKVLERFLEED